MSAKDWRGQDVSWMTDPSIKKVFFLDECVPGLKRAMKIIPPEAKIIPFPYHRRDLGISDFQVLKSILDFLQAYPILAQRKINCFLITIDGKFSIDSEAIRLYRQYNNRIQIYCLNEWMIAREINYLALR